MELTMTLRLSDAFIACHASVSALGACRGDTDADAGLLGDANSWCHHQLTDVR